jgi:hypothetical protein
LRLSRRPPKSSPRLKNPPTTRGQPAIAHGVTTSTSTRLLQTCESLVKEYASVERAIGMVAK